MPVYIATTKFNNQTFKENNNYKEKNNISGCIYGVNMLINNKYKYPSRFFVIEMNNETNKIEGIGYISNNPEKIKPKIYSNDNFNRYIYKSKIPEHLIDIFELILFKGKSNVKRISGISVVTEKLFLHWKNYNYDVILYDLKQLFLNHIKID
jgi:hypothetical protein